MQCDESARATADRPGGAEPRSAYEMVVTTDGKLIEGEAVPKSFPEYRRNILERSHRKRYMIVSAASRTWILLESSLIEKTATGGWKGEHEILDVGGFIRHKQLWDVLVNTSSMFYGNRVNLLPATRCRG